MGDTNTVYSQTALFPDNGKGAMVGNQRNKQSERLPRLDANPEMHNGRKRAGLPRSKTVEGH